MKHEYKLTADGYIQNEGEPHSRSARVELSANPHDVPAGAEKDFGPAGHYVVVRMLDVEKLRRSHHQISHIGVTLSLDEAESFARDLLEFVSNARAGEKVG
jgi:hypothetical protein